MGILSIKGNGLASVGQSERAVYVAVLFISTLESKRLNTISRLRPSAFSYQVLLQEFVTCLTACVTGATRRSALPLQSSNSPSSAEGR